MEEIWKDIEGFEGKYQISNFGRVKSFKSNRKEKILKQKLNSCGYLRIMIRKDKKYYCYFISHLVAKHFIPNPENKPQINHKNCIKIDNRVGNLEWCTRSENIKHAYKHGRINKKGENHHLNKLTWNQVQKIREEYAKGNISQRKLSNKYNLNQSAISRIVNDKRWKAEKEIQTIKN